MDVYAFGVVLYELISAKEAIIKTNEVVSESKGLVALVLSLSSSSNLYICVYIYISAALLKYKLIPSNV